MTPPAGWDDRTEAAETRTGSDFQAVYEGPRDGGVTSSIAIVRTEAPEAATLESISRAGRDNIRKAYGTTAPGRLEPARLGGERAVRLDYETERGRVRQVGALRAGYFYLVTFNAAQSAFTRRLPAFDALVRSWRWD